MRYLWNYIEDKNWKAGTKYRAFLWVLGFIFGVIGLILWSFVQLWTLKAMEWMICFVGYPVILSWFVVFLYSCNHDFHDGRPLAK